jgi:hypothetical protein
MVNPLDGLADTRRMVDPVQDAVTVPPAVE